MRPLDECNPMVTVLYFLFVLSVSMFTMNPVILGVSLVFSVLFFCLMDKKGGFKRHIWYIVLLVVLTLINPLVYHNGVTVLFILNDNPVTLEALLYGLVSAVKIVSALYWFRSFSLIMTEDKLLYCMGRLSPKTALVLSMTLRYVPLFKAQAGKVSASQKAIGFYKEDSLIDRVRGALRIFSILVTWALENGIITADSMGARGYGTGRRTSFSLIRFTKNDAILLSVLAVLFVPAGLFVFLKQGEPVFYPAIIFPASGLKAWAAYLVFTLLALVPELLLLEDRLSWKYYLSKA